METSCVCIHTELIPNICLVATSLSKFDLFILLVRLVDLLQVITKLFFLTFDNSNSSGTLHVVLENSLDLWTYSVHFYCLLCF